MRSIERLLDAWEQGNLDADGLCELHEALADRESRAILAARWNIDAALTEILSRDAENRKVTPFSAGKRRLETARAKGGKLIAAAAVFVAALAIPTFLRHHDSEPAGISKSFHPPEEAEVSNPEQTDSIVTAPPFAQTLENEAFRDADNWITTGSESSPVRIAQGPWKIDAFPGSQFRMYPGAGTLVIEIRKGTLKVAVSPYEKAGLRIRTPQIRAHLRSGEAVILVRSEETWLGVDEGAMEVQARKGDGPLLLRPGEYTTAGGAPSLQRRSMQSSLKWQTETAKAMGDSYP